jgi:hypothetical protein
LSGALGAALALAALLILPGCWTPPNANVQPKGEPRLIEDNIHVQTTRRLMVVQSVDTATRTIVVRQPGEQPTSSVRVGPNVSSFDQLKAGDTVEIRFAVTLAVYVRRSAEQPQPGGAIASHARVLSVDPSYRLLTLQYPGADTETFKVSLDVQLARMESGNDVVIRPVEAIELRRKG